MADTAIHPTELLGVFENGSGPRSVVLPRRQTISMVAGSTVRVSGTIRFPDGRRMPLDGATLRLIGVDAAGDQKIDLKAELLLPAEGRWSAQFVPADTATLGGKISAQLWVTTKGGARGSVIPGLFFEIEESLLSPADDEYTTQAPQIPFGVALTSGPTRMLIHGDSVEAQGVAGTQAQGGLQVELQHLFNLFNKDVLHVGPTLISGPATVDGLPFNNGINRRAGTSGSKIDTGGSPIAADFPGYITTYKPHLIILGGGTNNVQKTGGLNDSGATVTARMAALVDTILAADPNLLLCLLAIIPQGKTFTVTPAYSNYIAEPETSDALVGYRKIVTDRQALGKRIVFADCYTPIKTYIGPQGEGYSGDANNLAQAALAGGGIGGTLAFTAGALTDGLHPNQNAGYPLMARAIYPVIESALASRA